MSAQNVPDPQDERKIPGAGILLALLVCIPWWLVGYVAYKSLEMNHKLDWFWAWWGR